MDFAPKPLAAEVTDKFTRAAGVPRREGGRCLGVAGLEARASRQPGRMWVVPGQSRGPERDKEEGERKSRFDKPWTGSVYNGKSGTISFQDA